MCNDCRWLSLQRDAACAMGVAYGSPNASLRFRSRHDVLPQSRRRVVARLPAHLKLILIATDAASVETTAMSIASSVGLLAFKEMRDWRNDLTKRLKGRLLQEFGRDQRLEVADLRCIAAVNLDITLTGVDRTAKGIVVMGGTDPGAMPGRIKRLIVVEHPFLRCPNYLPSREIAGLWENGCTNMRLG
jgi:hypothetical protein